MRILITGIGGFIGSHLSKRLSDRGHEVFGLTRPQHDASASSKSRLEHLKKFPGLQCLNAIEDVAQLTAPLDACVHLAGRSSVRESLQNPALYERDNCQNSVRLLTALHRAGCRRVIHASTVMIYGKDAPLPYREDSIGSTPGSFYGASKLAVETLMNTWRTLQDTETINLRLFSVYGPELRADCVPHLIATAIERGHDFTIFGDGSSIRDYIEIEDVLDAIEAALTVKWNQQFPLAINIGSGIGTSLVDLLRMIEQGLGKNARVVHKPTVAGELPAIIANIERSKSFLNWQPRVNIKTGIQRLTDWFKQSRTT